MNRKDKLNKGFIEGFNKHESLQKIKMNSTFLSKLFYKLALWFSNKKFRNKK